MATRLSLERLEDRTVPRTFTVRNLADSGPESLRQAILDANANPGADLIRFAPAARDGTITLTGGQLSITDDLAIDGPGANRLSVSGNDASRVFQISSGVTAGIDGLTVTHGHAFRGGGILNDGTLALSHVVVSDNVVVGLPGATMASDPFGGGILNTGSLTVRYTTFVHNRSVGGDGNPGGPGSTALGGAIFSAGFGGAPATATVSHCTFLDNQAIGGAAGVGAPFTRSGIGGAIVNDAGTFTVSDSVFHNNQAIGGAGGGFPGGFGAGGAIANIALFGDAILSVSHSALTDNRAVGGAPGTGTIPQNSMGGAIANLVAGVAPLPVTVTATATITDSMLLGNQAIGGAGATGGNGGNGQGGGIANLNGGIITVIHSALIGNEAIGGAGGTGGNGGNGLGGGVFNGGPNPFGTPNLTLLHSLVALNRADGGAAGDGGSAGLGLGGGLYLASGGIASADLAAIILANDASTSDDDVFGVLSFI